MNQDLYYVVTPEFEEIDEGVNEMTGNKEIDLYEILNNKPVILKRFSVDQSDNSVEVIEDYIGEVAPELFADEQHKLFTLTQL